jgi:hypothetical protein
MNMEFLFPHAERTYKYFKMGSCCQEGCKISKVVYCYSTFPVIYCFPNIQLSSWLFYCKMLCINIDPISLLTWGRKLVRHFFLLISSSLIPPPCIIFLLKLRLCVLLRIFRPIFSFFLLQISSVVRNLLQFLSLFRGVISWIPSVVSLVTEDEFFSPEKIINLFNSRGSNGTVCHPHNCTDELYVAFRPCVPRLNFR